MPRKSGVVHPPLVRFLTFSAVRSNSPFSRVDHPFSVAVLTWWVGKNLQFLPDDSAQRSPRMPPKSLRERVNSEHDGPVKRSRLKTAPQ